MSNNQINSVSIENQQVEPVSWIDGLARKVLIDYLGKMSQASLTIYDQIGQVTLGNPDATLEAVVEIHNTQAYRKI